MSKLKDKVALITGGSSGIGLATAKLFISEGAFVFITGRREQELRTAVAELGDNSMGVQGHIDSLTDLDTLYARIRERKGRIDILFANAGIGEFLPLGAITEAHFDNISAVNVKGTLFTVQKALPLMPDGAAIVLNASITSITAIPAFSVYSATKAAVRSFARGWAVDLKDRKIRVNAISPGTVPTPGYAHLGLTTTQVEAFLASQNQAIPLGRVGRPEEIARAVLFLASEDSSFVNGIELFVDGGMTQI
jgi:NAD(P)-dependent dehydrogenase (short-subunit alcohol dehydrogenase family)